MGPPQGLPCEALARRVHVAEAREARARDRRLVADELGKDGKVKTPGEERRLLAVATPWLQRLIIAAVETGCRRGELLSLQWTNVSLQANTITIRAEKAKDGDRRVLPVSQRLKGVPEMVRHDPEGKSTPPPLSSSETPSADVSPTRRKPG